MPDKNMNEKLLNVMQDQQDLLPGRSHRRERPSQVKNSFMPWIITGTLCIAAVFGTLGSWGVAAPIASAVIALGQVTVETNRKQIGHLEGGIVETLSIRNGSHVKAGDNLISLDRTQAKARLAIVRGGLDENLARLARLKAEASSAAQITYPRKLLDRQENPLVNELIRGENEVLSARRLALDGEIEILNRRVDQLELEVLALEVQLDAETRRKEIVDQEVSSLEPLFKQGHVSLQRLLALRREAVQMEGNIGSVKANIARSKQAIGETKLQIVQLTKEAQQNVLTEMGEVQSNLKELREQYSSARDILNRMDMIAPVSGTIVGLNVHSKGAVIRPGETILEIVPDQDALLIEVQIQPQDVDSVAVGQESQVRFTAFKQRTTPLLGGAVSYVSPDTLQDSRSGRAYYLARIAVPKDELDRLEDAKLAPGMPAEVMIRTGSRTAVQYLVQPIIESMDRAWRED